jgi:hypothetical protein
MPKFNIFREKLYKYKPAPKNFTKKGEATHGEGRHKPHKIGDRISYVTPRGRTTGRVIEVCREYYIVKTKGKLSRINRNSILYQQGTYRIIPERIQPLAGDRVSGRPLVYHHHQRLLSRLLV